MITTAFVKIWGETVGAIAWNKEQQIASFEYTKEYSEKGKDLAPIKMPIGASQKIYSFPELRNNTTFKGIPGLLADVLPDKYGSQLINAWLAKNGRPENSLNPIELLCFIGNRGMGALEFEPTQFKPKQKSYNIELDSLVEYSKRMLQSKEGFNTNIKEDEKHAMLDLLKIGTSAGGARPKAIIAYNEKTGKVKSGQTLAPKGFEHWLIKLDGVNDTQFGASMGYGRVEMAYYLMAKDCGIHMMPSKLIEENGRAHFMTKRYDRESNGTKHHVQTFCALQHFDFNEVTSFSYEQLFQTMRILHLPYPQAEEMYRRMVFNVFARNCDDHTKNFSFRLKQEGEWELSPAYDICHAYRPDSMWVSQHALSMNGKRKDIQEEDLLAVAHNMNIKKAKIIIDKTKEVVSKWEDYATEVKLENKLQKAIKSTLLV